MKKLKDLDSHEQSVQKLEFCLFHIDNLEKKEVLDMNDQIMINLLLNVFKSSMEYSIQYLRNHNNISKSEKPYILNKEDFKNMERYYELLKQRFGVDDKKGRDIFDGLFETSTYNQFNNMQNKEKHAQINTHTKTITKSIGYTVQKGITIENVDIIGNEDNIDNNILINDEKINYDQVEGYSYDEIVYFEYNNKEVFEFLYEVFELVNNFVVDIKEYVDSKE
ncbi:hypothetical protein [Mammaliicoccus sciuri]|uniref:hypothetical protein n=1 Tax=Mammaliicoccus sciuri TaxID=1296 RepID=UPI002DBAA085|nr:hypothetical protein [Mammaliicoccus sciuri]MEB6258237.1 hypothetical protein [Mammaliicoccus sciuri]MEB6292187.1 hypothetical protein [Mammaliicoccus sciuri]MEB8190138.1 hypothetical protein [Mammaliicoccus sciuri]